MLSKEEKPIPTAMHVKGEKFYVLGERLETDYPDGEPFSDLGKSKDKGDPDNNDVQKTIKNDDNYKNFGKNIKRMVYDKHCKTFQENLDAVTSCLGQKRE